IVSIYGNNKSLQRAVSEDAALFCVMKNRAASVILNNRSMQRRSSTESSCHYVTDLQGYCCCITFESADDFVVSAVRRR
ncbi:MAG: hypothetical protein J6I45_05460, partial [Clostridia bacterium]|nr:hypothetical protein [Clostridia bacterium]